jgi:hypothetical protein
MSTTRQKQAARKNLEKAHSVQRARARSVDILGSPSLSTAQ